MTEHSELSDADQITAEDLAEIIVELEQYRERLINDALTTAQRAKLPQSKAKAALEPQLAEIDAKIQELRNYQAAVSETPSVI